MASSTPCLHASTDYPSHRVSGAGSASCPGGTRPGNPGLYTGRAQGHRHCYSKLKSRLTATVTVMFQSEVHLAVTGRHASDSDQPEAAVRVIFVRLPRPNPNQSDSSGIMTGAISQFFARSRDINGCRSSLGKIAMSHTHSVFAISLVVIRDIAGQNRDVYAKSPKITRSIKQCRTQQHYKTHSDAIFHSSHGIAYGHCHPLKQNRSSTKQQRYRDWKHRYPRVCFVISRLATACPTW
jgi:hypothetical protein